MHEVMHYTHRDYVKFLESGNKFDAIEELAMIFAGTDICPDTGALVAALREREEIMSTGIGFGLAIPHAKIPAVKRMAFAVGISRKGLEFDSMDGEPVHLIIMVAAGEKQHKKYLKLLSNIMSILKKESVKTAIIGADNPDTVIEILGTNAG